MRLKKNDDSSIDIRNNDGDLLYSLFHKATIIPSKDLLKLTINTTVGTSVSHFWSDMYYEDNYSTTPTRLGNTLDETLTALRTNFFN